MYIPRLYDIEKDLEKKSVFLLGARQTGKSSLIRHELPGHKIYNLLNSETFAKLSRAPQRIREELTSTDKIIIIDEIQLLPNLLNEIHLMIEEHHIRFLLTGSSARKLRHGGINLLGGRALLKNFHPLCYMELQDKFNLTRAINYGLLPSIYLSDTPDEDLTSYIGLYLRTEIAAEGITRNIPAFGRFLEVAALCNSKMINYTKISNDAQVARTTVQEYFQILKDTLIGYELPAWNASVKRKPISTSKFYFFDIGITRYLQNRGVIKEKSPEFGEAFESYMFHELKTYADYNNIDKLAYWRSVSNIEVDFILGNEIAIEVKGTRNVTPQDLKNIKYLQEERKLKQYIVVCFEDTPRITDHIRILPWQTFLEELWAGKIL